MSNQIAMDTADKPKILIADDSRIVRAMLIRHIEGLFDFREALDGEQAWETLLVDPTIRVVITDLTMPVLDGYGLLQRIRSSRVRRIRNIPVIVVSGSDEYEERERAKAAGANDLITKGIGTPQLLSRIDVLARLAGSRSDDESMEEVVAAQAHRQVVRQEAFEEAWETHATAIYADAIATQQDCFILIIRIGSADAGKPASDIELPSDVLDALEPLLARTVRQTDHVSRTGETEFAIVTAGIDPASARNFACRVCLAISGIQPAGAEHCLLVASCGLAALSESNDGDAKIDLPELRRRARRRAALGLERGMSGVVGCVEEIAISEGRSLGVACEASAGSPDLATLLQWIRDGREGDVLPYLGKLSAELQPLLDLMLHRHKP